MDHYYSGEGPPAVAPISGTQPMVERIRPEDLSWCEPGAGRMAFEVACYSNRHEERAWCTDHPYNWEGIMRFRTAGILLLGTMTLAASAVAQTAPAPPAITRTVVATSKLSIATDVPFHFKAVSVTLPPGGTSGVSAPNGILYQVS